MEKTLFAGRSALAWLALVVVLLAGNLNAADCSAYDQSVGLGRSAAREALNLIKAESGQRSAKADLIVMTDAGYAEVDGRPTMGALDGLAALTGASRGRNTLVEMHAMFASPLWFAVYDKASGLCAYLEADSFAAGTFKLRTVARVDVGYLRANVEQAKALFDGKLFGGNEFRIVTAANGIAAGAPACMVRAFEFHDHFCPGIASGVVMAEYLKQNFAPGKGGYFVHSINPWCKEDALLVLLNATPGKKAYAVSFPGEIDLDLTTGEIRNAATIVYRQNDRTKSWEGLVLGFGFGDIMQPQTGNAMLDKVCADLYLIANLEQPEKFVKVVKRFELPQGVSPLDWARPGLDPLKQLGLLK